MQIYELCPIKLSTLLAYILGLLFLKLLLFSFLIGPFYIFIFIIIERE
jgi:hypothetical protein